jgi:hypothetical protein
MFDLGSIYPAALDVFNAAGVLLDPQTAVLTITLPDGTTTSPVITLPSTVPGQLRYNYLTVQPGRHLVRWQTQNPSLGYTDAFDVAEAAPPMILSLAMAKKALQIDPANTSDDDELREMLMGITKAAENYKNEAIVFRQITGESHQFDLWSWSWQTPRMRLDVAPVITLTSLTSEDGVVDWLATDGPIAAGVVGKNLFISPSTGIITVVRGTPVTGWVIAGYTVGYQVIPYNYLQGAKVLLQWVWESRRGPGGLAGVVGPEELHSVAAHPYLIPRKAQDWLGPQFPAVA